MGLDRKKFEVEVLKIKSIKASHITDGEISKAMRISTKGSGKKLNGVDFVIANRILESQGYHINTGIGKGYVNRNFGYRL